MTPSREEIERRYAAVREAAARDGLDAIVAAAWALFGIHDLTSGKTARPDRERRRDVLAQMALTVLPGGKPLLARAQQAPKP